MTTWTRETANTDRERKIVTAMVVSTPVLKNIGPIYKPRYFSDLPFAQVVSRWCLDYLEKYGVAPQRNIQDIFEAHRRNGLDPDQAEMIDRFLTSLNDEYLEEREEAGGQWQFNDAFHLDLARSYFRERALKIHLEGLEQDLATGNIDAAEERVKKFQAEAQADQGRDLEAALRDTLMPFRDFARIEVPKPRMILKPWLEEATITLLAAATGTGKTWFQLEIAAAAANCRPGMAGRWTPGLPFKTLIIDGEMSQWDLQTWGKMVGEVGLGWCELISKARFQTLYDMPFNLFDERVREALEKIIVGEGFKLVNLDNIYSLIQGGDSNKDTDWAPINDWLLKLRAKGVASIPVHHTGHDKTRQMGTSSREFNVNNSLVLKNERSDKTGDNCCFSIDEVKARGGGLGLKGKKYLCENGRWTVTDLKAKGGDDQVRAQVAVMLTQGKSEAFIASSLGLTQPAINGIRVKLRQAGLIVEEGKGRGMKTELSDKGGIFVKLHSQGMEGDDH